MTEWRGTWACADHGEVVPLLRPRAVGYAAFGAHLRVASDFPTYLPWPLGPGWTVSDFGVVAAPGGPVRATLTSASGTSALDGPTDLVFVSEEPGTGLGARVAGTGHVDPGPELGDGPPVTRLRLPERTVPLWLVSTSAADERFDRTVLCGEADGRWMWVVVRPASALLLLRDDWILRDVAALGPALVELPFGGAGPVW